MGLPGLSPLLPPRLLASLLEETGANIATLYLSDTESPFARSSYFLLGVEGVSEDEEITLHGPLRPESVSIFSIKDQSKSKAHQHPTLILPDTQAREAFRQSGFVQRHGIKSLVRLSIRLTGGSRKTDSATEGKASTPKTQHPPKLLELFLSYQVAQDEDALQAAAQKAFDRFESAKPRIRQHEHMRSILDTRAAARRFRKLREIENRLSELSPIHDQPSAKVKQRLRSELNGLRESLIHLCHPDRDTKEVYFSLFRAHRWDDGETTLKLVHAYPAHRKRLIQAELASDHLRSLCRFVAKNRTSAVIPDLQSASSLWTDRRAFEPHEGSDIVLPLYSGRHLFGVLNIETKESGIDVRGLAKLVRLAPEIDSIARRVFEIESGIQEQRSRWTIDRILSLPMAPSERAVPLRLEAIRDCFNADNAHFFDTHDLQESQISGDRAIEGDAPIENAPKIAKHLASFFADNLGFKVVCWENSNRALAPEHIVGFRTRTRSRSKEVSRQLSPEHCDLDSIALMHGHEFPEGRSVCTHMAIPLWSHGRDTPERKNVRGVLILRFWGRRLTAMPADISAMDDVSHAFATVAYAAERMAEQMTLYAWAVAGIGPLHQLQHVLNECREDVEAAADDPGRRERAIKRIQIFEQQMFILHQFARQGGPLSGTNTSIDLVSSVKSAVEGAKLLTGETDDFEVRIAPECEGLSLRASEEMSVTTPLICAISNSVQYGVGFDGIYVNVVGPETVRIQVRNRAAKELTEQHLNTAGRIAKNVDDGEKLAIFMSLAKQSRKMKNRGLGTWLAAGITKSMLDGRYEVDYHEDPDDELMLIVTASVYLPLATCDPPEEEREQEHSA